MALFNAKNVTIRSMKIIGKVIEKGGTDNSTGNIYMDQCSDLFEEEDKSENASNIPAVFQREEAIALLVKLKDAGYLDECYQKKDHVSWSIASIIANEVAVALNMPGNWKPFETLWNHYGLRNNYDGALNTNSQATEIAQKIRLLIQNT